MKNKKIIVSAILIVVFIASLTAASYAWFSANQNVALSQLDVNVAASNGIQISTDATIWKAAVTTTDLTNLTYTGNRNLLPTTLMPVSSPKTVTLGNLDLWDGLVDSSTGSFYLVNSKLTDPTATVSGTLAASTTGNYIAFDIFVQSTSTLDLKLSPTSSVVYVSTDTGLKNAARVAIINEGVNASASTARALTGGLAATTWLWEPNANIHTANGVIEANTTYSTRYGTSNTTSTVLTGYDAVKANILLTDTVTKGDTATTEPTFFAYLTQGDTSINLQTEENAVGTEWTAVAAADDSVITSISAGINKLRVYAWIEGQDVDCENGASGKTISFNLGFTVE